jgi:hypothetical protein
MVREIRHTPDVEMIKRHGRTIEWQHTLKDLLGQLENNEEAFAVFTFKTFEYAIEISCLSEFWHAGHRRGESLSSLVAVPDSHNPQLQN